MNGIVNQYSGQSIVKLPKVSRNSSQSVTNLNCFDNFTFNDNFTRNKIVIRDLQDKYQQIRGTAGTATKFSVSSPISKQQESFQDYSMDSARMQCSGLQLYKKFQLESLRRRDSKHRIEPITLETAPERTVEPEPDPSQLEKLSQVVQKVSRSYFREFLHENKPPGPNAMKIGLMNPRDRRYTKRQQYNLLRTSKLLLLQEYNEQLMMEQDYRRVQEARIKNQPESVDAVTDRSPAMQEPSKEENDYLRGLQNELMSKMDFYVKRVIKDSGEYLIQPTLQELHKNTILKPIQQARQHRLGKPMIHANRQQGFCETKNKSDPLQRALEIEKLLNKVDMRTPLEKTFFRMVQASDSFEVNNMLIKNPKLLTCTDSKGNTVLHEVSKLGDTELLTVLLEYGGISLLNAKNNIGQSATDLCRHFGNEHLLPLLKLPH